jgi:penicillin-binding protein 2
VSRFVLSKVYGAALLGLVLGAGAGASAATITTSKTKHRSAGTARVATKVTSHTASRTGVKSVAGATKSVGTTTYVHGRGHGARPTLAVRRTRYHEHFSASSFADNLTLGDVVEGEDPVVRAAAIEALGNMNGTAIAIDPSTGRILAMVNQKLALSRGAEPCSTIKLTVALAALEEGIVRRDTPVNLGGRYHLTMTEALAHSNNLYFETLGRQLGFERVKHYANQFGLGELAGYHIQGEQLGTYPDEELPAALGGVGRMCSFGESVSGTLYYLQHPESSLDLAAFEPKVKRTLDIAPLIPEISVGMEGAVQYGTARSLRANFSQFPVMGKTGTCSNNGTRFGWFGSYADTPNGRIVTVFFLEGGRPTFGPKAAELTGEFYRSLWDKSYFLQKPVVAADGAVGGTD